MAFRDLGPARTFGLLGACAALGGLIGFVTGYLDLPEDARTLSPIVDWRSRIEVTGAHWQGLVGAIAGLVAGALLGRAWLAFLGGVIGAGIGFILGGLLGMIIEQHPLGGAIGAFVGSVAGSSLGFLVGLGADLKRHEARRSRLPAGKDLPEAEGTPPA